MTDPDLPPRPSRAARHDDQEAERSRLGADFRRRLSSVGPVVGHDDLGGLVRTLRSLAGLSQRELAGRAGVPERTLARIESEPDAGALWSTVTALLTAARCRLQVLGPDGKPAVPWVWEAGLGEGGRHVPAHLSVSLPFDGAYHRRLSMVRPRPRLPLYRWSLRGRPDGFRLGPADAGPPSSPDAEPDQVTPPRDGPMLWG
jgi:DNA-binding XRE family transcriptional regulator